MSARINFTSNIEQVKRQMAAATAEFLETAALKVEGDAILLCPTDTGNLRNSISHEVEENTATIGTNVEYASHVELGTSKQGAQPFLRPALDQNQDSLKTMYKDIIKRHID